MNLRPLALRFVTILVLALLAAPAGAQQTALELDPARTHVEFTLGATLHTVHGTLKLKQGNISFNPATGEASGRVIVDATSAGTGNDDRDDKMHREILESQKYSEIVFTTKGIEGPIAPQGNSRVRLSGTFTIHGSEQETVIDAEVRITGNEWTAETSFPVPYVKWGLKNPSTFLLRVKDTANVTVRAAGRLTGGLPASR